MACWYIKKTNRPSQASAWYQRMFLVYALGTWSLLGSIFFFSWKKKPSGDEVEQKPRTTYEIPISANETPEPQKGFYVETMVTYKDDFVPVTDKILNYLKSWTGGPGPES